MQEDTVINLEPVIAPEPVSFWPPQPGWYLVIVILLLIIIYGVNKYLQYQKKNRYRKLALQQFEIIKNSSHPIPDQNIILALNKLLKVTAINGFPRKEVACLSGKAWVNFLEQSCKKVKLSEDAKYVLASSEFVPPQRYKIEEQEWSELLAISERWIKNHKMTT